MLYIDARLRRLMSIFSLRALLVWKIGPAKFQCCIIIFLDLIYWKPLLIWISPPDTTSNLYYVVCWLKYQKVHCTQFSEISYEMMVTTYKVTINKDQWFNLPKRGFVKHQICSHGSEISYDSYQKWLHSPKKLYGGYKVTINKGQWFNVPKQQRILMCNEKCIKLPVLLCLACK